MSRKIKAWRRDKSIFHKTAPSYVQTMNSIAWLVQGKSQRGGEKVEQTSKVYHLLFTLNTIWRQPHVAARDNKGDGPVACLASVRDAHDLELIVSLYCNGTQRESPFCHCDMFINFVKNSNSMCDAALSMWLASTATTKSKNEQKPRVSLHNRPQRLQKPLKINSFNGANLDFSSMLHLLFRFIPASRLPNIRIAAV